MSFLKDLPKPFFVLAPMDDVTDTVFRQVVADLAPADLFFTEFVNVDGLQSPGRERLMPKLWHSDREKPIIAQIWGLKPENFYKTAKDLAKMGYDGVDLNMGCPVKTVIKNGACSALINNRELAKEIIDNTKKGAGSSLSVSVKTRVGITSVDLSWFEFLLEQKLDMLTIHFRTVKQMSKVPADWNLATDIVKLRDQISPSTLLVGNGDVMSKTQATKLANEYGLDGVMVGRGIFNDPYLFAGKSQWVELSKKGRLGLFTKHIKLFQKTYPNRERKFEPLRKFCKVYINGFEGASELRDRFMHATNPQEALDLLEMELRLQPSLAE